jgi:methylated-DNA-[protein]-cysteine S-methyltransferase
MKDYFAGGESEPDILLDMSLMSDWQRRAGQTMMQVPRGQVRTYSWLAASMGAPAAPRAAGTACARNPLPVIVPCHRIIRSSGGLGGFGGGLALKRRMLEMEGAGV